MWYWSFYAKWKGCHGGLKTEFSEGNPESRDRLMNGNSNAHCLKSCLQFHEIDVCSYKLMHIFREEHTRWKKVASMRTAIKCVWGKSFKCSLFLCIIKDRLGREQEGLFTSADTRTTKYVKITALGIKIEVEMCWNNFLNCKQHWGFQHPSGVCQVCILLGKEPTAFICQSHRCIKITTATTSAK